MLIGAGDFFVEEFLLLDGILQRFHFLAIAKTHRALEPHAAELAGGPGDAEEGCMETAARHALRAKTIALAPHDREHRYRHGARGDEHARHAVAQRGLFMVRPDHATGRAPKA